MKDIHLGEAKLHFEQKGVSGGIVKIAGEAYYQVSNYDRMPDFFISVVSDSDHWMFLSSNGSLAAGRKDRDNALFPYYTDDKIHDYRDKTGSKTSCLVHKEGHRFLWEPFAPDMEKIYRIERNLYKSIYGNKILFEERNLDLEVGFRYGWYSSEKYGWVRKSQLETFGRGMVRIEVLDGIRNILPYGIDYAFQNEYSNLGIAYRKNELLPGSRLGLFMLSSIPVDTAEPSEALKATTVWSAGAPQNTAFLLSDQQLEKFRAGEKIKTERDVFASKGSYYAVTSFDLEKDQPVTWYLVAEISQDATAVGNLDHLLQTGKDMARALEEDIATGTSNLVKIVASADGLQLSSDQLGNARHFSNTLFNVMRGGVFENNYMIQADDLRLFVDQCNTLISRQFEEILAELPTRVRQQELLRRIREQEDPDLERICYEYLPLTFSRRHGDPSRPWNQFSIETRLEDGRRKISYQGNWRDIFQNWEALCLSYPGYIESVITRFVNASTADGYNPYRITREGIDWECPEPGDPWAYIGYWGDHQVIYLQKFLEQSLAYHPGKLDELLQREIFVYADVPYRIKAIEQIIEDPKDTIVFDWDQHAKIEDRVAELGSDGKLLRAQDGNIYRVNLMEKILCSLLAKLINFIPGAGIWLNTQRPEWNDANNALVGNGTSMVTLYYLRRSLRFWKSQLESAAMQAFNISEELFQLFERVAGILKENSGLLEKGFSDRDRYMFVEQLGRAGSDYRNTIYTRSFSGNKISLPTAAVHDFLEISLAFIDRSTAENRRSDGLYNSYNLVSFSGQEIAIRPLYLMLEGQVAALSSGCLDPVKSLELLDALKASELYRADQNSYLLYPLRELPRFTEKNNIPREKVDRSDLLQNLLSAGDTSILSEDNTGSYHFNGRLRNARFLSLALDKLGKSRYGSLVEKERKYVLDLYESVFDHQSFTGRSGTFYGYEGIGSIYWHMVSKLLLAVREVYEAGEGDDADAAVLARIRDHYYAIKEGLGVHKSPALHGAFPVDPYSHTPAGSGAKQPGLTGQVKEDILSRFGELGVMVKNGMLVFHPSMLSPEEKLAGEGQFRYFDPDGVERFITLEPGQLAFTVCQVPVVYQAGPDRQITVTYRNGEKITEPGDALDAATCGKIFGRTCEIVKIEIYTDL